MNNDLQQLLVRLVWLLGVVSILWVGVTFASHDMHVRNGCYQQGVTGLPQGMDQTFLQTQSDAYKRCLSANISK